MAKRSIGSLVIDLEARTKRLEDGLKRARARNRIATQRMQKDWNQVSMGVQGAAAKLKGLYGVIAGSALISGIRSATAYGSALTDMAKATQTAIVPLQILDHLARETGASQEQLRQALSKTTVNAQLAADGNAEYARQFEILNLNVSEFLALPTEKRLEALGKAVGNASDENRAYLAVTRILGEEAGPRMLEMLERLGREGWEPLAQKIADTNVVLSETDAIRLDHLNDQVDQWATNVVATFGRVLVAADKLNEKLEPIGSFFRDYTFWGPTLDWLEDISTPDIELPSVSNGSVTGGIEAGTTERIAPGGAGDEEKRMVALERRADQFVKAIRTPQEELLHLNAELIELQEAGLLTSEQSLKAYEQAAERLVPLTEDVNEVARELGLTFTSAFEDAVLEGGKLSDVLQGIAKDIARIILRRSITEPLLASIGGGVGGGIGGALGAIFAGFFRAEGGPVTGGNPYIVGEKGPEVFVPSYSGSIVPNHELASVRTGQGGGDSFTFHQHFAPGVSRAELAAVIPQIVEASRAAVVDAKRRRRPGNY